MSSGIIKITVHRDPSILLVERGYTHIRDNAYHKVIDYATKKRFHAYHSKGKSGKWSVSIHIDDGKHKMLAYTTKELIDEASRVKTKRGGKGYQWKQQRKKQLWDEAIVPEISLLQKVKLKIKQLINKLKTI